METATRNHSNEIDTHIAVAMAQELHDQLRHLQYRSPVSREKRICEMTIDLGLFGMRWGRDALAEAVQMAHAWIDREEAFAATQPAPATSRPLAPCILCEVPSEFSVCDACREEAALYTATEREASDD